MYVPFSTSAPTTVLGTVIACQPAVAKPGLEISSPLAVTFAEDSRAASVLQDARGSGEGIGSAGGAQPDRNHGDKPIAHRETSP